MKMLSTFLKDLEMYNFIISFVYNLYLVNIYSGDYWHFGIIDIE